MKKSYLLALLLTAALCAHGFDDCAGLAARGRQLEKKGDYRQALLLYRRAAKLAEGANGICETSSGEGRCLAAMGEYDAAEKCFRRLIDMDSMAREEHYYRIYKELIGICHKKGDRVRRDEYLKKIIPYAGDERFRILANAREAYREKNYLLAEAILLKGTKIPGRASRPDVLDTWKLLAESAFYGGDHKKAYEYLDEFCRRKDAADYPTHEMERIRGELLILDGRYEEAVKSAEMIAHNSVYPFFRAEAYNRLAKIYHYHLKDPAKAKENILRSEALKAPWGFDAGLKRVIFASERKDTRPSDMPDMKAVKAAQKVKDYAKVKELLKDAVNSAYPPPIKLDWYIAFAEAEFALGNRDAAYRCLDRCIGEAGATAYVKDSARRFRNLFLFREKKYQEALDGFVSLAETTAVTPYKAEALTHAARIRFHHIKDMEKAREYILKAESLKAPWGFDAGLKREIEKAWKEK